MDDTIDIHTAAEKMDKSQTGSSGIAVRKESFCSEMRGSSHLSPHGVESEKEFSPAEDMEEEKDEADEDESCQMPNFDQSGEADSPSNSKGSVLGLDYTVKEISVTVPKDTSVPPPKKKRRRKKVAKTYYCAYCDFNSPRWDRLKEHLIVHYEDRPFACEHCDFKTKTAKKLKRHQTVHSEERKYECSLCKLTFKRAHTLKEHILTHSKEKMFFCSLCDYSTHRSQYLKRHMMKHTNEKLQCDLCKFQTVYATLLRRHYQSHTGKRRHRCAVCNTYSSSYPHCVPTDPNAVEKTATIFKCGECDFSTTRPSSLRTHMYVHVKGDKKFKCDYCEYSSMRKCDLRRHRMRVHRALVEQEQKEEEQGVAGGVNGRAGGMEGEDKNCDSRLVVMDEKDDGIDNHDAVKGTGGMEEDGVTCKVEACESDGENENCNEDGNENVDNAEGLVGGPSGCNEIKKEVGCEEDS